MTAAEERESATSRPDAVRDGHTQKEDEMTRTNVNPQQAEAMSGTGPATPDPSLSGRPPENLILHDHAEVSMVMRTFSSTNRKMHVDLSELHKRLKHQFFRGQESHIESVLYWQVKHEEGLASIPRTFIDETTDAGFALKTVRQEPKQRHPICARIIERLVQLGSTAPRVAIVSTCGCIVDPLLHTAREREHGRFAVVGLRDLFHDHLRSSDLVEKFDLSEFAKPAGTGGHSSAPP